ncbi:Hypothetical predicted protein [Mytilus galloprovincialis]|uniref:Amino acid transporter transmembrane domain-containing protein n=1 Tax=Mytilus galloprovincialis TaxID=29158 RepID=A0A8B6FR72_MYTGA|nr:Hypothetical predicted protein [Mytilus galloprovincialis]
MEQWTLIQENNNHGLTVWTTSVFIVGNIAGGGVLALPKAVEETGWIGFILIIVFGIFSTYTATLIGESWVIIQERYPEYRSHVPDPYPVIGEIAYGRKGRHIVNVVMNIYNYGSAVVYMVLAAGNIETLLAKVTEDISLCYWLIILAGVLAPLICLGDTKGFLADRGRSYVYHRYSVYIDNYPVTKRQGPKYACFPFNYRPT